MFHALVGIAAAIFIWKTFQEWRHERAARRALAPYAGLAPRSHTNFVALLLKIVLVLGIIGAVLALAINGQVSH